MFYKVFRLNRFHHCEQRRVICKCKTKMKITSADQHIRWSIIILPEFFDKYPTRQTQIMLDHYVDDYLNGNVYFQCLISYTDNNDRVKILRGMSHHLQADTWTTVKFTNEVDALIELIPPNYIDNAVVVLDIMSTGAYTLPSFRMMCPVELQYYFELFYDHHEFYDRVSRRQNSRLDKVEMGYCHSLRALHVYRTGNGFENKLTQLGKERNYKHFRFGHFHVKM